MLGITIFESGPGGLFTAPQGGATPGNYITLPNQAVDDRGNITVPYAGTLRAKGRTAIEVQQAINGALKDSALKPQALVSLVDQRASSYSVLGEVHGGGRYAVSASGERLLEAIARAVMSRLLHEPTIRLRSMSADRGHASLELVRELFGEWLGHGLLHCCECELGDTDAMYRSAAT